MDVKDIILSVLYIIIIIIIANNIKKKYNNYDYPIIKYFIPALIIKIIASISIGLIYKFYYGAGDTLLYFNAAKIIYASFSDSPVITYYIYKSTVTHYYRECYEYVWHIWWHWEPRAFFFIKITGIVNLFAFNSYYVTSILFATISFFCSWRLYLTFYRIYPVMYKEFAYAILFLPSVCIWGSGIFKDTVIYSAIALLTSSCYNIFINPRKIIWNILLAAISIYLILNIRGFILLCFGPCLIFWIFLTYRTKIKFTIVKRLSTPVITLIAFYFVYLTLDQITNEIQGYSKQELQKTLEGFQTWHTEASEQSGGTGYTLGDPDYSYQGLLKKLPMSINVSLFRPYPWEVKNFLMLLSSLESFAILLITIYVLFRSKIFTVFKLMFSNPHFTFCILFGLLYAFVTGLTSYNFGALVRYKIAAIPFYMMAIFLLANITKVDTSVIAENKPS